IRGICSSLTAFGTTVGPSLTPSSETSLNVCEPPGPRTGVPPRISATPSGGPGISTHNLQVLRTLACGVYSFAERGEQTVRLAYERAIERGEHFVYIEDQFLWPCSLV